VPTALLCAYRPLGCSPSNPSVSRTNQPPPEKASAEMEGGLRQTIDLRGHRWARIRPCRASHFHLASTVQSHVAGSYKGRLISPEFSWKVAIHRLWRCLNPILMSAASHYGLRYGSAPATGDFQRLRGRPPLVNPLKSCLGRSFTAMPQTKRIRRESGHCRPRRAVSFLCPSQLDVVRFRQLFQRVSKTVHAGLLIVKLL
jgi:hypothetical protein